MSLTTVERKSSSTLRLVPSAEQQTAVGALVGCAICLGFIGALMNGITLVRFAVLYLCLIFMTVGIILRRQQRVIGLFIGAAITHIFILFFDGTGGYLETVRAACYSMVPTLLIGWTIIGAIATPYWGMAIQVFALHEFHEISKLKAVFAVFIPIVVFVVLYYMFIIAMLFSSVLFFPA